MILLIDNYDSFTFNIFQLIGSINTDIKVIKNNELTIEEVKKLKPSHIIISPGAGRPENAGICQKAIKEFYKTTPILGVCLGHQAICQELGGNITYAKQLMHGKRDMIHIANGSPIFKGLPPIIEVGRYHSLVAERVSLPEDLLVIAEDNIGEVMAVKHKLYNLFGIQFHPESILTNYGIVILENFLKVKGVAK